MSSKGKRRSRAGKLGAGVMLVAACGAAGSLAAFLDRRRRRMARDRAAATVRHGVEQTARQVQYAAGVAKGAAHGVSAAVRRDERDYDDATLARKVETEIFRPADAPKADVSVNVQHGVVELRGEVKRPEDVKHLGEAAARVEGVKDVHNLLHTPGSPPRHSPASDPEEVRERADEPGAASRFARNPATTLPADEPMTERTREPKDGGTS